MSIATKLAKAKRMGIKFEEGHEPTEKKLDEMIEQKAQFLAQQKEEEKIARQQQKKADDDAKKNTVILKDVDGDEVDQEDYFWPRLEDEKIGDKTVKATDQTAPLYFNKVCGMPVDRDELIEIFLQYFPRSKGFLFYKARDREVYLVIVPLKFATTISRANESRPGDFQRHALSFVAEGSVNVDSLKLKLQKIAKHTSISTEAIAR